MDRAEGPKSTSATRRHGNILISKIRRPEEGSPARDSFFLFFKPKMFTLRLIMRPHRTEPQGKTFCETANRFPENASRLRRVDGEARPAPRGMGGESRARPRRTLAACTAPRPRSIDGWRSSSSSRAERASPSEKTFKSFRVYHDHGHT